MLFFMYEIKSRLYNMFFSRTTQKYNIYLLILKVSVLFTSSFSSFFLCFCRYFVVAFFPIFFSGFTSTGLNWTGRYVYFFSSSFRFFFLAQSINFLHLTSKRYKYVLSFLVPCFHMKINDENKWMKK